MIEALEDRRLYSGAIRHSRPVFSVDRGTLNVSGSVGDDVIVLGNRFDRVARVDRTTLTLNGRGYTFRQTISRFVVYGGGGNDDLRVTNRTRTHMDGGTGNDTLYCAIGDDTLFGGNGDDTLTRENGNTELPCYMDAGPGDDRLTYGTTMYGGRGYDTADFNPSASADYVGFPFNIMPVVGGMEESDVQYPYLTSRGGNYELVYRPDGFHEKTISGPMVRADGKVAITVTADFDNEGPYAPNTRDWRVPLGERYTALAQRRGLVLSFTTPDGETKLGESTLLLPGQ